MPWYGWFAVGVWTGTMAGVFIAALLQSASRSLATWLDEYEQAIAGTDLLP